MKISNLEKKSSSKLIGFRTSESGSLALEQVLFIGAVIGLATGLFAFYDNISTYLQNVGFSSAPSDVGSPSNN